MAGAQLDSAPRTATSAPLSDDAHSAAPTRETSPALGPNATEQKLPSLLLATVAAEAATGTGAQESLLNLPDVLLSDIGSRAMANWSQAAAVSRVFHRLVHSLRQSCEVATEEELGLEATGPALVCRLSSLRMLPNLCVLKLRALPLTDADVAVVASHCPKLRSLDLSSCSMVGDVGARHVSGLAALESIDLTFCNLVSYSSVVLLRERCPALRLVRRQPEWCDGQFETPWGEVRSGQSVRTPPTHFPPTSRFPSSQSSTHRCMCTYRSTPTTRTAPSASTAKRNPPAGWRS